MLTNFVINFIYYLFMIIFPNFVSSSIVLSTSALVFRRCLLIIRCYPFFISASPGLTCSILSLFITQFLPLLFHASSYSTVHGLVPSSEPNYENTHSTTPYQDAGLISNNSLFSVFYSSFIFFLSFVDLQLMSPSILCFLNFLKFIFLLCCFEI